MADQDQEKDKIKVQMLDEEMRDIPREIRDVLEPVQLKGKDCFRFRCYPGISCFNVCCCNIDIVLTPYDILRLRRRLNLTSEEFLYEYATPSQLQKGQLPVAMMRMHEETGRCPFVTDAGCRVYSDRPVTCRYYPIGLALMHKPQQAESEEFYFLIKEGFCTGHAESKVWSVDEWRRDQGSDGYDVQNRGWMEVILKRRSAGDMTQTALPVSEFFYMATTNPEAFRRFVFDSSFMKRYEVDSQTEALIRDNDEAMIDFAFSWLKSVLFGDKIIQVRADAWQELQKRKTKRKASEEEKK
ncbi:MAG: YkgJ family cysteine cluster protein [Magnetococcus sp. DMHC-6]